MSHKSISLDDVDMEIQYFFFDLMFDSVKGREKHIKKSSFEM